MCVLLSTAAETLSIAEVLNFAHYVSLIKSQASFFLSFLPLSNITILRTTGSFNFLSAYCLHLFIILIVVEFSFVPCFSFDK